MKWAPGPVVVVVLLLLLLLVRVLVLLLVGVEIEEVKKTKVVTPEGMTMMLVPQRSAEEGQMKCCVRWFDNERLRRP